MIALLFYSIAKFSIALNDHLAMHIDSFESAEAYFISPLNVINHTFTEQNLVLPQIPTQNCSSVRYIWLLLLKYFM